MDVLKEIIEIKKTRIAEAKQAAAPEEVRAQALAARSNAKPHRFLEALANRERINIIAEIKRSSPSKGTIREAVNAPEIACSYEESGAAAISVLTEADHFQGSLDDLRSVRDAVSLPLLRKDFILEEYQVYESAAAGADAILLIVAALDDAALMGLRQIAEEQLGLDALVEVHTASELRRAANSGARLIGVNNRDLRTLTVSLQTSIELAPGAPDEAVLISESGIESSDDIQRLRRCGYRGFLIGESLMRADDPGARIRGLSEPPAVAGG
jgi:indole-3-glycerol phosphate synthase